MKDINSHFLEGQILIRNMIQKDIPDLINSGFTFSNIAFNYSLKERIFRAINLSPRQLSLVAFHTGKKRAIGFLSLVMHTKTLCSVRYIFTDPNFRKMGVATGLINYASILAKEKRAKRVFLTTDRISDATRLYQKLGFRKITEASVLKAEGCTSIIPTKTKGQLIRLQTRSDKDKNLLFKIYQRSLGQEWINFFETNRDNLLNGYSQDFQSLFSKTVFTNDSKEFFAIVFSLPFLHTATAELYGISDALYPKMLEVLMRNLLDRGITYVKLFLFNINDLTCFNFLEEKQFYPYQGIYMGRSL
jgi:N-acetylglutamate synthase-like GNAT family acetyltransferase